MLQVLYSVTVCMRGHNSPASSNEEGGIDSSCDDYELDDQLVLSHAHTSTPAMRAEKTESVSAVRFACVILQSSDPPE